MSLLDLSNHGQHIFHINVLAITYSHQWNKFHVKLTWRRLEMLWFVQHLRVTKLMCKFLLMQHSCGVSVLQKKKLSDTVQFGLSQNSGFLLDSMLEQEVVFNTEFLRLHTLFLFFFNRCIVQYLILYSVNLYLQFGLLKYFLFVYCSRHYFCHLFFPVDFPFISYCKWWVLVIW